MRLGRHMPLNSKPLKAVEIAQQLGCNTIQIFASNPTGWRPAASNPAACTAFAQAAQRCGLDPIVIHAPYLVNLASPDDVIWEKSIALLRWTMQQGALLGAKYVIFHTGSHRGSGVEAGIARIAQATARILPEMPPETGRPQGVPLHLRNVGAPLAGALLPSLLLENDVGAGNALGHSFEQIGAVLNFLPEYSQRLGVCLDTAHLWGAGFDISSAESVERVLEQFDEIIGVARLKVIHLNDTGVALGSHRDLHARLGEGIIGEEGLRALLCDPQLAHVVVLLETPIKTLENGKEDWEHDKQHFETARKLVPEM